MVRPTAVTEYEDGSKCSRRFIMFGPKPYNNGTMIERLADLAAEKGVEFFFSTPGVQLVTDESGAVTGVIGKSEKGYIKFNATKGVVMPTGDYQNIAQVEAWGGKPTDKEKIKNYMPDVEIDRSPESGANVIEGPIDTYCCDTLDELAGKLGVILESLG